jgi:hypothetical protein
MIVVIGNSPKKISIPDLNDYIYYKQRKSFSDADRQRSRDLQKEIAKGTVIVVEQVPERSVTMAEGSTEMVAPAVQQPPNTDLLDRLHRIESLLSERPVPGSPTTGVEDRIKALEDKLVSSSQQDSVAAILSAVRDLGSRVGTAPVSNDELLKKMEELLARAPGAAEKVESYSVRPEDIYVPSVTVEDGTSHVRLQVRTIETADSVTDAAAALKKIRNNT